jgi:hypothetical protein
MGSLLLWLTHVLQEGPVTGRAADANTAANTTVGVALRLVRPGKKVINCKIFPPFICIITFILLHM